MREKTHEMTMLLDFYGEMLTEKQRECFTMHYNEDLSLAEIAEIMGISRQGVRDLIVRAEATLTETEEKIGLIKRFDEQKAIIESMEKELTKLEGASGEQLKEICRNLREQLESISY